MNGTILVVEDNRNDVMLLRRAFSKARLANPLRFVEDGEQAVAYLLGDGNYGDREEYPFPVMVLLDLKLPRKSGLEVLEWLKQQETLKRLPVVVFTSSQRSEDVNRAYDLGVNSYLVKPVTFDALLEVVKNLNLYWVILNEKPEVCDDDG